MRSTQLALVGLVLAWTSALAAPLDGAGLAAAASPSKRDYQNGYSWRPEYDDQDRKWANELSQWRQELKDWSLGLKQGDKNTWDADYTNWKNGYETWFKEY